MCECGEPYFCECGLADSVAGSDIAFEQHLDGSLTVSLSDYPSGIIKPKDITTALASAAEGFPAWDVLDAAHMLVSSLLVDLVSDNDRPAFLRKMDRVLRDRVKEIGARQKPRLVV